MMHEMTKHRFLRAACLLLALALCACTGEAAPASSKAPASSAAAPSAARTDFTDADGYWNVRECLFARDDLSFEGDVSVCFPADAKGYRVEGGPYKVDVETLTRLTTADCVGDGSVQWAGFRPLGNNPDNFDGVIPVSKLHDPVYCSMNWPSEVQTYMTSRVNPQNMAPYSDAYNRLLPIGAIYQVAGSDLRDDDTFTVCLGRMVMLLRTEHRNWYTAVDLAYPPHPGNLYYLPWELETTLGHVSISDRVTDCGDHIEIVLKGSDLNGTFGKDKGADGAILHFWGAEGRFGGEKVLGCVAGLTAWIKEPDMVGKVAVAYGADWYGTNKALQCFSGYNVRLTTEPRFVFGHNVGPNAYDSVMDVPRVKTLLGLS